ncbi:hypothetical protein [Capnocytophaga gingivalis]|uniref:DUF4304 domain-containing protein n=1 Tax=Capnocytophaga gingivalis TaxID=1017 RepID=A0ABU5Z6M3_9FLAO|nr:hypothetical protein [Capnocytophaga gingivalis]MEB3074063.1 hypothetical protein [Capnocytophaga gingivalis]
MDKEKAFMEALYSKYGSILENNGYKPNKAQNKYSIRTKNSRSEVSFLFSKRSDILHLVYSYTDLKAGKLRIDIENQIRIEEGREALKLLRPTFIITDWKNIFTLYGYDYRKMPGWFTLIETIEQLEEETKNTFPQALEIIIDLDEKFKTLDGVLDVLWKKNNINEYMNVYDAINILVISKLKSGENLLESYQKIISCSQYKNLSENAQREITKYFNILEKS